MLPTWREFSRKKKAKEISSGNAKNDDSALVFLSTLMLLLNENKNKKVKAGGPCVLFVSDVQGPEPNDLLPDSNTIHPLAVSRVTGNPSSRSKSVYVK